MTPAPNLPLIFHPRNAFSMGKSEHHSSEARGPIVTVKNSNDVPICTKLQNAITQIFAL